MPWCPKTRSSPTWSTSCMCSRLVNSLSLVPKDKEFTNLEHMQLVHRCKELSEKANKARNMMIDEELKRSRKEVVEYLYKESIFEKMDDSETAIKCSSCEVRLQGHPSEKKRIQQLFIHFIG